MILKAIRRNLSMVIVLVLFISQSIFAQTGNKYVSGTWGNPTDLYIQLFNNAYQFNSTIYKNYIAWNKIDKSLNIVGLTYSPADEDLKREIKVYGEDIGEEYTNTLNYKKVLWWYEPDWTDCNWGKAVIKVNTDGSFDSLSEDIKAEYFVHELGHAIGLTHSLEPRSIMREEGSCGSKEPLDYDKKNLISKWNVGRD